MQRAQHDEQARLRILRLPDVKARTGLSRTAIYIEELAGRFPRRRKLTERAVGWSESEIDEWVAAKLEGRPWKGQAAAPAGTEATP